MDLVPNHPTSSNDIEYATAFENQSQTLCLYAGIWGFRLQSNPTSTTWHKNSSTRKNNTERPNHICRSWGNRMVHWTGNASLSALEFLHPKNKRHTIIRYSSVPTREIQHANNIIDRSSYCSIRRISRSIEESSSSKTIP